MTDINDPARHATKMAKKKAARDKIMATKTEEKGLVIVNTGKGKGKSKGSVLATSRQGLNELLGNVAFIGRYDEPAPKVHMPIP